jgi:Flp pilus assembly protein TadD
LQHHVDAAVLKFSDAAASNASSVQARLGLATALYQSGRSANDRAVAALLDVLAVDAHCHEGHALLGIVLAEQGRWHDALQHSRVAASLRPDMALYRCAV